MNKPTITARHCEAKTSRRVKIYDSKCSGLYVSKTAAGVATFYLKCTSRSGSRETLQLDETPYGGGSTLGGRG